MHTYLKARKFMRSPKHWLAMAWLFLCGLTVTPVFAESLCAVVKIEIRQELAFERQAFDARMLISNGLDTLALENVSINLTFLDDKGASVKASSNPAASDAQFFVRVDSLQGISNISGSGQVAPTSSAEVHWLIIPAAGAAGLLSSGKLYLVGASLTYAVGGEVKTTEVAPDSIVVKPVPLLTLDYFLTKDVVADDPFTDAVEPVEPFTLGVRIKNSGGGTARKLKIESAQPKIVENRQGLLIGFNIIGSSVNDQPSTPSLLTSFGDLAGGASTVGRWIMTTSLSGRFTEFTAEFSHSDELGGELTSLLQAANTHFLLHDVRTDLPGRDNVRDFLALDGDVLRVYESSGVDTAVSNQSALSSMSFTGQTGSGLEYHLAVPRTAGYMYVRLPDPNRGASALKAVLRSDGKVIPPDNAWLSRIRNADETVNYFISFFDVNTTDSYQVLLGAPPQPPELQIVPNFTTYEGKPTSFTARATDQSGVPTLSAAPLPTGASFADQSDGTGVFNWTPAAGQAGDYTLTYTATLGPLQTSRNVLIKVNTAADTDGDGLDDAWEIEHFGNLDRDGTGDYDHDGVSDLQEFKDDTDPGVPQGGPEQPQIKSPGYGAQVNTLQPQLMLINSRHSANKTLTYQFEVYADMAMAQLKASAMGIAETQDATSWTVTTPLADNSTFYWRARAFDGIAASDWVSGKFFVNTANDAPGPFNISRPQNGGQVDTLTPVLEVNNSTDADGDVLYYSFRVYSVGSQTTLVASSPGIREGGNGHTTWTVNTPLQENIMYYWRAIAVDLHGGATPTAVVNFFVNTRNDAPTQPAIAAPATGSDVSARAQSLTVTNASDPDRDRLTYYFEIDKVNTFDSPAKRASGPIAQGATTTRWNVAGLADNTRYYWRAQAFDGAAGSPWAQADFFVNTANDPPSKPTIDNPGLGAWVAVLQPSLSVNPSVDVDNDKLIYRFEVYKSYTGGTFNDLVTSGASDTTKWTLPVSLEDNRYYVWRARAEDIHGAVSPWMNPGYFFVNNNNYDDPPDIFVRKLEQTGSLVKINWGDYDVDSNATIAFYYDTDNKDANGVLIVDGIKEDPDGDADTYVWDVSNIPPGVYYVYAVIRDATTAVTRYAATGTAVAPRLP